MIRESYEVHKVTQREEGDVLKDTFTFFPQDTSPEKWFDPDTESGLLSNYLLDPQNVFSDQLSKNLLMLAHNETDFKALAKKRFKVRNQNRAI